jgi:excisionase family DNA binding protein
METSPMLMRVTEAAAYLAVSRSKLYALISSGALPGAVRIGKSWRVSRPALEKWIENELNQQSHEAYVPVQLVDRNHTATSVTRHDGRRIESPRPRYEADSVDDVFVPISVRRNASSGAFRRQGSNKRGNV